MLRKLISKSVYRVALRTLTSPVTATGDKVSTAPCISTFARVFGFEDRPSTVPSMLLTPVAKFGCTVRSAKLVSLSCSTIFLMAIGMVASAGAGAGFPACCVAADLSGADLLGAGLGAAGLVAAGLVGAGLVAAASASTGAVVATGLPPGCAGATTVAPGPANTRFTFKLVSGSMMMRAYSLRAVTWSISSRSGLCWKFIPDTSKRSQLIKSSCNALSTVWTPAMLILDDICSVGLSPP